jgi:hypothetical protein
MDEEQKRRPWATLIATGILVLVGAAILYVSLESPAIEPGDDTVMYGPWRFERDGAVWKTLYQRGEQVFDIRFRYLPSEVENITISGEARLTPPFVLSFDPDMSNETRTQVGLVIFDSTLKLRGVFGETPTATCTSNETDRECLDLPAVTCDTPDVSVFVFSEEVEPSITLDGRCIRVAGTGADLYRAETLMWYRLLGIVR